MTTGIAAMLLGLFGVPLVLLWAGHRLRRRSPRWRRAFWGALVAHLLVMPPVLWVSMLPPADWSPTDRWRGAIGLWGLLAAPVAGALVGLLRHRRGTDGRADD
ncbi:MAG: hypothetical protein JWL60_944 [Gemmatimonadetes bacterium]|jgi:hypothetical protein|nr:hypothetical protein [Gemmatimonadota bacterium]